MPTNYPGALDSYTNKVDGVTDVLAADTNNLQDAMVAVQTRIGVTSNPTFLPRAGGTMTGGLTMGAGILSNVGYGTPALRTSGDIGGSYASWSNDRGPALQVDAPTNSSAYMIWRATKWNERHLAGMDAYAGGTSSSTPRVDLHVGTTTNAFVFEQGGNFTAVGNVTAYSDERLKTNWRPLPADFLTRFAAVKHGAYERTDTGATQVGVSAQSLREVMPEAVMENDEGMLSVAYGNAALAACVALAKEVMSLRDEVRALKQKLGE